MNDYLDRWLAHVRAYLRPATADWYQAIVDAYIRRPVGPGAVPLGAIPLSRLEKATIESLYGRQAARGLAPATVGRIHAILSGALQQAVRWRLLESNPAEGAAVPKGNAIGAPKALTRDQAMRLLAACARAEHGIVFEFALCTGMRPEEYLALRWKDLDLEGARAVVRRTVNRKKGGGWDFTMLAAPPALRAVALPAALVERLERHRRATGPRGASGTAGLVFPSARKTPLDRHNLGARAFKPLLAELGLPDFPLYGLRHTCALLLQEAGCSPEAIDHYLGRASVPSRPASGAPKEDRAAAAALQALLYDHAIAWPTPPR